ncbi:MAG: flagellar hook-basal body complex protein FliE [Porcipelethomonas sp.]
MFIVPLSELPSLEPMKSIAGSESVSGKEKSSSFGDILKAKIQNVKDLEAQSLQSAYDISVGKSGDIESAMMDSAKASTAIEMTTQITTRVVNAYKEIMSMQI